MNVKTAIILVAPFVCLLATMMAEEKAAPFALCWLGSSILCLAWGFYVSRRSCWQGWTCIGFSLIQFSLLLLPFFLPARHLSHKQSCIALLKQLEGAKATWALEHHKGTNDVPTDAELFGPETGKYIRNKPVCPEGGSYALGKVGEPPRCSILMHSLEAGHVYVVDSAGVPIVDALVSLPGRSGFRIKSQTDTNGFASINPWADGGRAVLVSKPGYKTITWPLTNAWPARIILKAGAE